MKKNFVIAFFCLLTYCAKSQDYNFTSAYDKINWPVDLGLKGGIVGDDGTYKKLTLFHGDQISFQTGTNTVNAAFTRMVINSIGNVGIGTTEPGDKLTVQNAIRVAVSGTGGFYAADAANGGNSIFSLTRQANNLSLSAWDGIGFSTNVQAPSTSYKMYIQSDGKVGIGTISPVSLLHLCGASPASGTFLTLDDQATTGRTGVRLKFASLGVAHWHIGIPADVDAFTINGWLGNSNPEYFRINSTGNIGIGTTTPDAKLAVNGTIHSKEVKVDLLNWPDYVFKPAYKLRPLSEVKAYVDQNQHLPEMPSEKEIAEKGLDLGEMDKLLIKKVEELTLYLIQKDKENKEQGEQISRQQAQIDLLIKQVKSLGKKKDK